MARGVRRSLDERITELNVKIERVFTYRYSVLYSYNKLEYQNR